MLKVTKEYIEDCKEHSKATGSDMYAEVKDMLKDGKAVLVDKDPMADYVLKIAKECKVIEKQAKKAKEKPATKEVATLGEVGISKKDQAIMKETAKIYEKNCGNCGGDGVWKMGPITNGVPARVGKCYGCQGKGYQTYSDKKRNETYWNYNWNRYGGIV